MAVLRFLPTSIKYIVLDKINLLFFFSPKFLFVLWKKRKHRFRKRVKESQVLTHWALVCTQMSIVLVCKEAYCIFPARLSAELCLFFSFIVMEIFVVFVSFTWHFHTLAVTHRLGLSISVGPVLRENRVRRVCSGYYPPMCEVIKLLYTWYDFWMQPLCPNCESNDGQSDIYTSWNLNSFGMIPKLTNSH